MARVDDPEIDEAAIREEIRPKLREALERAAKGEPEPDVYSYVAAFTSSKFAHGGIAEVEENLQKFLTNLRASGAAEDVMLDACCAAGLKVRVALAAMRAQTAGRVWKS